MNLWKFQSSRTVQTSSSSSNQLLPKQEPTELQYSGDMSKYGEISDYPQVVVEKRSSWAPPAHNNHTHKRESVPSYPQQVAPPPIGCKYVYLPFFIFSMKPLIVTWFGFAECRCIVKRISQTHRSVDRREFYNKIWLMRKARCIDVRQCLYRRLLIKTIIV